MLTIKQKPVTEHTSLDATRMLKLNKLKCPFES